MMTTRNSSARELWHQAGGSRGRTGALRVTVPSAGAHQRDAHGLQQQVPQAAGIRLKEESPVGVQQAGNHGLHRPGAGVGEVRWLERQRADQSQQNGSAGEDAASQGGDRLRSSRMICDSRRLIPSMTQTVRNRQNRIMPTLPYSSHEIFSFSSRPMPPAPT